uniref:TonB-dependent receptor n=1 Tax=Ningiella ruwaisensis TaxID=2364274 RepID=UPI0014467FE0|nr:TonB-dependent receptor [Ningiella ruwaisensis]
MPNTRKTYNINAMEERSNKIKQRITTRQNHFSVSSICLFVIGVLSADMAYANSVLEISNGQETDEVQSAQTQEPPRSTETVVDLEVIEVTAQRRVQNLQDVPVSITAISTDALESAAVKDIFDLEVAVPGLQTFLTQSATQVNLDIRGVGTSSQNFGLESSVGLYVDDVFRARQNSIINNLVDLEAVEILRGPQGTLFGKNTPSGAVVIRTKAPRHDELDALLEATFGNYGLMNFAGATNLNVLEDELSFRFTGFSSNRDGYVSDISLGEDSIHNRDRYGLRAQMLWTPNDDLRVRVIADYSEIDEICCAAPTFLSNFQSRDVPGVFGTDAIFAQLGGSIFTGDEFFDYRVALNSLPISQNEDKGISAQIDYTINDAWSLTSITAMRDFSSRDTIDGDFTDIDLVTTTNRAQQKSYSQELRFNYTAKDLNAVLGAYYFTQDLDLDYKVEIGDQFDDFYNAAIAPSIAASPLGPLLDGLNQISAATGGLIAPVGPGVAAGFSFPHIALQEHTSYALFGQFDYNLTDNFILTAGLRYTDEDKDLLSEFSELNNEGMQTIPADFNAAGAALGEIGAGLALGQLPTPEQLAPLAPLQTPGWAFPLVAAATAPRPSIDTKLSDSQTTGTVKLSYVPNSDTLLYISYATGYKSGGTNTDRIPFGFTPLFDAETAKSFEVGIKKDFPEQALRINAAIHSTQVDDFQANTYDGAGFNLQNAGELDTFGGEVELTWLPTDNIQLNLNYSHIDAEYGEFEAGSCYIAFTFHTGIDDPGRQNPDDPFCSRAGDRLPGSPEHKLNAQLRYDLELADNLFMYAVMEGIFSSDIIRDSNNDPLKIQPGYSFFNARVGFELEEFNTEILFWGRNIFNKDYYGSAMFDTTLQDGKISSYTSEPRTFGVTIRKHF